jgi:hypothetical protein
LRPIGTRVYPAENFPSFAIRFFGDTDSMANKREPVLQTFSIMSLRPTQMTVGMREVKEKRKRWRAHKSKKRAELLGRRMIPVVLGPDKNHYVIDHHHMARACMKKARSLSLFLS